MLKLSLGVGFAVLLLLSQVPTATGPESHGPTGPFENTGQVWIVGLTVLSQLASAAFLARQQNKREESKDKREKEKEDLALAQRKLDLEERESQREYDLKDRQMAREEAAHRREAEAAEVKRELEVAKRLLADKADKTAQASAEVQERVASEVTKVGELVNGQHTALIEKVERLTAQLATVTGRKDDRGDAVAAAKEVKDEKVIIAEHTTDDADEGLKKKIK